MYRHRGLDIRASDDIQSADFRYQSEHTFDIGILKVERYFFSGVTYAVSCWLGNLFRRLCRGRRCAVAPRGWFRMGHGRDVEINDEPRAVISVSVRDHPFKKHSGICLGRPFCCFLIKGQFPEVSQWPPVIFRLHPFGDRYPLEINQKGIVRFPRYVKIGHVGKEYGNPVFVIYLFKDHIFDMSAPGIIPDGCLNLFLRRRNPRRGLVWDGCAAGYDEKACEKRKDKGKRNRASIRFHGFPPFLLSVRITRSCCVFPSKSCGFSSTATLSARIFVTLPPFIPMGVPMRRI